MGRNLARLLMLAAAIACAIGSPATAAPSISASATPADDHGRHCKCGDCDPKTCCCGPLRTVAPGPDASPSSPSPSRPSPCLRSIPCGSHPGLPSSSIGVPGAASATLAAGLEAPILPIWRHRSPTIPCDRPARRASRLDDPPEAIGRA
ncbi:hypothetical protein [Aquisphaera insulae]|uniref:hypothetical protein n=1 Tax=Aquisphaera insulae TaxID=2712864 RepID=UPI0013EE2051|nr:hypothetical protein [Aquisphaera insulae]